MEAELKWLDDPEVFRVNQLPAHSDHRFYRDQEEAALEKSSYVQNLNGRWGFKFSKNPMERPVDFYKLDFDRNDFGEIEVPSEIELSNFAQINYTNITMPWTGKIYRRPAYTLGDNKEEGSFSQGQDNTVGSYVRHFTLAEGLKNHDVHVVFEGVERAMYVWLNGHFIGYAEDSFTPSEFDLTPYLVDGDNLLAVEVYKHATSSWIEDQDMFRFSGIFRDVNLVAQPSIHVQDLKINARVADDMKTGSLGLVLKMVGQPGSVQVEVADQTGAAVLNRQLNADGNWTMAPVQLVGIHLWDNHHPYLYQLTLTVRDATGRVVEVIPYQFGFRRVEIDQDKVLRLNGKRLIINGVNRHEWNCHRGRAVTIEDMHTDLGIFKENNINAVRTSHYPDQIPWYYLCDREGIYMMAENNLESHATWQKFGQDEPSYNVPGSLPQWKEAVVDRARSNYETFKNHTAILFWSVGNESYAGEDILAMNNYYKEVDDTRPVHYEGVVHTKEYRDQISDFESWMYLPPKEVEAYLKKNPDKPFIECEYMHSMGNSVGGMGSYIKLLDKYPQYCGGFIWDFVDQAIEVVDPVTGQKSMRYGGDFDDHHADNEFSGDGICFADRAPKPAMQEVKYYYGLHK